MVSRNWWRVRRHFLSNSYIWCEKLMAPVVVRFPTPTSGAPLKITLVKNNYNIPKA